MFEQRRPASSSFRCSNPMLERHLRADCLFRQGARPFPDSMVEGPILVM